MGAVSRVRAATGAVSAAAEARPLLLSVGFTAAKTGAADAIAQTCLEGGPFDARRNAAFWVFGAWFLGGAQYLALVRGMRAALPDLDRCMELPLRQRLRDGGFHRLVLTQSLLEMGAWVPAAYFPMYYWTKMTIEGSSSLDRVAATLRANLVSDLRAFYLAWIPFTLANYVVTPLWLRVPAIGAYSMLWTVYLSVTRGPPEHSRPRRSAPRQD